MTALFRLAAWLLVAALAFVTLVPIGLRPAIADSADLERAAAYILLGFLFALAYPRQRMLALVAGLAVAGLLEAAQNWVPSRHGRISDFAVKALAAGIGALAGQAVLAFRERRMKAG